MILVFEVVLAVLVVLLLSVAALRVRKLRRDERAEGDQPVERRLMVPPPSPYTSSKGFRLLDGSAETRVRPEPPKPRLEPDRAYVFSEAQLPAYEEFFSPQGRHDERWALSKAGHRSWASMSATRAAMLALIIVAVIFVGYYALHQHSPAKTVVTTTTTSTRIVTPRTTGVSRPATGNSSVPVG